MRNKCVVKKCLSIAFLLVTGLYANLLLADWSGNKSQSRYNPGFGDFPPKNINELFTQETTDSKTSPEKSEPAQDKAADVANTAQQDAYAVQNPATQNIPTPNYGGYDPSRMTGPYGGPRYNRGPGFGGPWNNNRSGFNGPWNNNRSGFSGPWNNRGSGFSVPWGNNRSGFSGPWSNNGSGFTGPWNNNGSSFGPWGNNGGWR